MADSLAPSAESLKTFLQLVHDGMHPYDAARRVPGPCKRTAEEAENPEILEKHESSMRISRYARRGATNPDDERATAFALAYADALEAFDEQTDARIESEYQKRAYDPKYGGNGSSNRMLHQLAITRSKRAHSRLGQFLPLLEARTRHVHEGAVGHFPMIDASKLSDEEMETFAALLRKAGTSEPPAQLTPPQRELPEGVRHVIEQDDP